MHQRLVEGVLLNTLGSALAGVVPDGLRKVTVALNLPDGPSPQLLPVFGYVQDVLHEDVYVDKDPVAFEILGDVTFVLVAIVLCGLVSVDFHLPQDGRPNGHWS